MMISIILNEWKILVRNRSIVYVSLVFMLSIISVVWMGNLQSKNQSTQRVDINVLKSKLRERENIVLNKN